MELILECTCNTIQPSCGFNAFNLWPFYYSFLHRWTIAHYTKIVVRFTNFICFVRQHWLRKKKELMKSKNVDLFSQVQILRMDTRYIFLRSRLVTMTYVNSNEWVCIVKLVRMCTKQRLWNSTAWNSTAWKLTAWRMTAWKEWKNIESNFESEDV